MAGGFCAGILIWVLAIGLMFAYGFGTSFAEATAANIGEVLELAVTQVAILGFGLLLSYSRYGMVLGVATALIATVVVLLLTPVSLKFWFNVFNGFGNTVVKDLPGMSEYETAMQGFDLFLTPFHFRAAAIATISYLAASTGFIGKLNAFQTALTAGLFTFFWAFALATSIDTWANEGQDLFATFDDFGANYVWCYAGAFSLGMIVYSMLIKYPNHYHNRYDLPSQESGNFALAGTGIIFATFPVTGILFPTYTGDTFREVRGQINIYFALAAGVVGCYLASTVFSGGKFGVKESLVGVLSGGIGITAVAGFIDNIGGVMAVGLLVGLIGGLLVGKVDLNKGGSALDSLGSIGWLLVPSVLAGFVVAPIVAASYEDIPLLINGVFINSRQVQFLLVYFLIFLGYGLITGIVTGLLCFIASKTIPNFGDKNFKSGQIFSTYGLYEIKGRSYDMRSDSTGESEERIHTH